MSTSPIFTSTRVSRILDGREDARIAELERQLSLLRTGLKTLRDRLAQVELRTVNPPEKMPPKWTNPSGLFKPEEIMREVCDYFGASADQVLEKSSIRGVVAMRRVFFRLLREKCRLSYAAIGKMCGFHHTTVIHSIEESCKSRRDLENYEAVCARLAAARNTQESVASGARAGSTTS